MTTELGEYFTGWRRRALLILLPAVAVITTVVASSDRATLYRASVDVTVPAGTGGSASSTSAYVANFRFRSTSPSVTNVVAKETGVPAAEFVDDLSVEQVGQAGVIRVTARHPDAEQAEELARLVSRETMLSLLRPNVAAARVVLERAQTRYDGALARIDAFTAANGPITPDLRADHESSLVLSLERQRDVALATGDFVAVAALDAQRVAALVRFSQAQAALRVWGPLDEDRTRALNQLLGAEQDLADSEVSFERARATDRPLVSPAAPESNLRELAQAGLLAGAAGLVLALGVTVALEQLRRRGRSARSASVEDGPADGAEREEADPAAAAADGARRRRGGDGDDGVRASQAGDEVRAPAHARRVRTAGRDN